VAQWRWLFGINVPIGIITVLIARYSLPQTERIRRPLNYTGALLYAGTFGLVLVGLQSLAHHAATPTAVALIACGALLGLLMVRYELSHQASHIPFDLLRIRIFSLSIATSVCAFIAQMSALVSLPFDIQRMGHSAVETGLLMTPWPLAIALMAPLAGRLADRYPAGLLGGAGLLVLAAGLMLLAFFPDSGTPAELIWRMALCGVGFGLFQSPNNRAMLAAAPRARSGAAGGMLSTARLIGQALGAAGVAILFRLAPAQGSRFALYVAAALAFVASLVSLVRLTDHKDGAHP
jgi:DHA2 family multidrug resistance protein-like MFS transporter